MKLRFNILKPCRYYPFIIVGWDFFTRYNEEQITINNNQLYAPTSKEVYFSIYILTIEFRFILTKPLNPEITDYKEAVLPF